MKNVYMQGLRVPIPGHLSRSLDKLWFTLRCIAKSVDIWGFSDLAFSDPMVY